MKLMPLLVVLIADGQFVLGDFPSIYGGPAQSGSKTAREYLESRAVALQRLGSNLDHAQVLVGKGYGKVSYIICKRIKRR